MVAASTFAKPSLRNANNVRETNFSEAARFREAIVQKWDNTESFRSNFINTYSHMNSQKKLLNISSILAHIIQLFPPSDRNYWTVILAVCAPELIRADDPRLSVDPSELIDMVISHEENSPYELKRMLSDFYTVGRIQNKDQSQFFRETMESYRSLFLSMALCLLLDQVQMDIDPTVDISRDALLSPLYMRTGMQTYHDHLGRFADDNWLNEFREDVLTVNSIGQCDSLNKIIKSADEGNAIAQHYLGRLLFEGHLNIEIDTKRSMKYLAASAKQGYAPAQDDFAIHLMEGNGIRKNLKKYRKYLKRSAESGYVKAQYHLGVSYSKGIGTKINHLKAIKWFTLAANNSYFSEGEEDIILLSRNNLHLLQDGFNEPTLRAAARQASITRTNKVFDIVLNTLAVIFTILSISIVIAVIALFILI